MGDARKRGRVKLDAATLRWVARWLVLHVHGYEARGTWRSLTSARIAGKLRALAAQEARRGK